MSTKALTFLIAAIIAIFIGANSVYIVNEFERGVLLRFGKVLQADLQPGLRFKLPWIDQVRKFESRVLTLDARAERFLTVEKKSMIVDSFAKWRIINVGTYYTATNGEEARAVRLLEQRINEGLRNQFAQRTLLEVVSGERDQLMSKLTADLNSETQENFGVEILDVRIKAIDLPEELSNDVYRRMRAERDREAKEIRSQGSELAEGIRAEADRDKTVTLANAYRESEQIKGEGDATAANIYAKAYRQDSEFYAFTRSLKAYTETFRSQDVLLLKPDSDFFRYMKDSKSK